MTEAYRVVPLIGPDGAGKTTLARALADAASAAPRSIQVDGRRATAVDIRTPQCVYQVVDFDDDGTEMALLAPSRFHGAVLVVSASDSVLPGSRSSLERAMQHHIPIVAAALTKCDVVLDPDMIDLVTMEVSDLLHKYGGYGDRPVLRTKSARRPMREREEPGPSPGGIGALLAVICR